MDQNTPILENVRSAEISILNAAGQPAASSPLHVNEWGQVMFSDFFCGLTNGILVATFKDGTKLEYRLGIPTPEVPDEDPELPPGGIQETPASWNIPGHYTYETDGKPVNVNITETEHRPTVYLKVNSQSDVTFDVGGIINLQAGPIRERPTAVILTLYGLEMEPVPLVDGKVFPLSQGVYRARFVWNQFRKPGGIDLTQ